MPELPEVETVRRGVHLGVVGRTIASVEVRHPRAVRRHPAGAEDLVGRLTGRTLRSTARRGKYLWLPLSSPPTAAPAMGPAPVDPAPVEALVAHLGMSGQLLVVPPAVADPVHLRVRLTFTDGGRELRFVDQRTFGGLHVDPLVAGDVPGGLAHIARDPLDPAFDEAAFLDALRRRRTGIKRALLDQTLVSGIGNIYADEALWRARLHYARPTETLPAPAVRRLLAAVGEVMRASLEAGGTSFDALYVSANGVSGRYDRSLDVYGREGEPCRRCGTPVRRDAFMNRSSFTCPRCQPRPRRARW